MARRISFYELVWGDEWDGENLLGIFKVHAFILE